ncbi:MAG: hypothetical protein ACI88A_004394 [Paraglaciecola sp.]|jgi:hypothetical protein
MKNEILMKTFLHDLSNSLMILEGYISIMKFHPKHLTGENIEKMDHAVVAAGQMLKDIKQSMSKKTSGNELVALTYSSKIKRTSTDITTILDEINKTALENNKKHEVSGFLIYLDGYFIQRLEGPRNVIEKLYMNISLDQRHSEISLLSFTEIESRAFDSWNSLFSLNQENGEEIPHLIYLVTAKKEQLLSSNESLVLVDYVLHLAEKNEARQTLKGQQL